MTLPPSPNPLPTTEGVPQGWQHVLPILERELSSLQDWLIEVGGPETENGKWHLKAIQEVESAIAAITWSSVRLGDILSRSFMYSDMGFDDRGNRSFKLIIKTQSLKDLQYLQAAMVAAPLPPPPGQST